MAVASHLLFRLSDAAYAVEINEVVEILPLPELSRLDDVPNYVVGMINLRGQVLSVIDLNLRFANPARPYRTDQSLVVFKRDESVVGMIVDAAEAVSDIDSEEIVPVSNGSDFAQAYSGFIRGVVKTEDGLVMVLDLDRLLGQSRLENLPLVAEPIQTTQQGQNSEETAVFRDRSQRFSQPIEMDEKIGGVSLALVSIGEELFGIELSTIREFADLRQVTPVPCCPAHVVGQMNLRGEIVTVLDVNESLGLPMPFDRRHRKVVVMESPDTASGVLVDELLDVLHLNGADLGPVPQSLQDGDQQHLRGTSTHGTRMFCLIDLSALLTSGRLTVNENP